MATPRGPRRTTDARTEERGEPDYGRGAVARGAAAPRLPGQRRGEGTVPTFLAVVFVLLPLWAIWYFLTHLSPFLAIQPAGFAREAPQSVRTYRAAERPAGPATASAATLAEGATIFETRCALCHGPEGQGGTPGPYTPAAALAGDPLVRSVSLQQLETLIGSGFPGQMPSWRNELNAGEVRSVAVFVQEVLGPLPPPGAGATTAATGGGR